MGVKLGKRAVRRDPRTLELRRYSTGALTPPREAHWGHGLPYQTLSNDKYGDCVEAGYAHMVQTWADRSGHQFTPDDAETLSAYTAITGFSPDDPDSDQGTNMLDACKYWKSTGLAGRKITAYLSVDVTQEWAVSETVAFYGGLYAGVQMPLSAQDQVGKLWDVTSGPGAAAGSWGGHCVPIVGYTPRELWCVTWGSLQAMTWEWLQVYGDEGFALLSKDWIEGNGRSPSGLAWGTLLADLANL